jgi:hypothetical protein
MDPARDMGFIEEDTRAAGTLLQTQASAIRTKAGIALDELPNL